MHKKFGKRLLSVTMSVLVALNFCGCGSTEGVAAQEMEPVVEDNTSDLETYVTESYEEIVQRKVWKLSVQFHMIMNRN